MFVIVSANVGEDSPVRNAPIADAVQPETINSNGVFRVTTDLGAIQTPQIVYSPKKIDSDQKCQWRQNGTESHFAHSANRGTKAWANLNNGSIK
jgi:hypothetical protein